MNKKEKTVPLVILQDVLRNNRNCIFKSYWQEEVINYIKKHNVELYKTAHKYADELRAIDYFTEEEKKKWGMTYIK